MSTIMEERLGGWEAGEPVIELYVAYDFLPAEQYARVLERMHATYQQVWQVVLARMAEAADVDALRGWLLAMEGSAHQLCIEASDTGESITVKFGPKGKWLLGWKFTEAGDLEVITPRWAAAAVLAVAAIGGGLPVYSELQGILEQRAKIEHQEHLNEQERLKAELLRRQLQELDTRSILLDPLVQNWAQGCQQVLSESNIREARINGIAIKRPEKKTPNPEGPGARSFKFG